MKRSTVRPSGTVTRRVSVSRRSTKLNAVVESSGTDHRGRAKIGWTISQPSASAVRSSVNRWRTPLPGRAVFSGAGAVAYVTGRRSTGAVIAQAETAERADSMAEGELARAARRLRASARSITGAGSRTRAVDVLLAIVPASSSA